MQVLVSELVLEDALQEQFFCVANARCVCEQGLYVMCVQAVLPGE